MTADAWPDPVLEDEWDSLRASAKAKGVGCKGWNYHIWSLGSDRCSMCRKTKAEVLAERQEGT